MSRTAVNWTPEMDAVLGTDRDAAVAGRFGLRADQVESRRKKLGIPGYAVKPKDWTPSEDAILGTDTLVRVAALLERPTSQIQKRMKQLGVPNFGVRIKPRSPARVAEEQAVAERNEIRFEQQMRKGMAVATLIADGRTVTAAAQELGIGIEAARQQLLKFLRTVRHRARLGEALLPPAAWREIAPWRLIPPHLLAEATRRMRVELETGSREVWAEPLPVNGLPGATPTPV